MNGKLLAQSIHALKKPLAANGFNLLSWNCKKKVKILRRKLVVFKKFCLQTPLKSYTICFIFIIVFSFIFE